MWANLVVLVVTVAAGPSPFFDYDCVSVVNPLVDWDAIHDSAVFELRRAEIAGVRPEPPPYSGRHLVEHADVMLAECPLAALYIAVMHFYAALASHPDDPGRYAILNQCLYVSSVWRSFKVHLIALSRWPIFEALALHSVALPIDPAMFCDNSDHGKVDWRNLRELAVEWAEVVRFTTLFDTSEDALLKRDVFDAETAEAIKNLLTSWDYAIDECRPGALWAFIIQMQTSAVRQTQYFTALSAIVDNLMLHDESLLSTSTSGWPIFQALSWLSDLNKGKRYVSRDAKYFRRFGDLDLTPEELAPVPVTPASPHQPGQLKTQHFARMPWRIFACTLLRMAEDARRPIQRRMLRAIAAVAGVRQGFSKVPSAQSCDAIRSAEAAGKRWAPARGRAKRRRAVGLILLYGERWSAFLPRILAHLKRIAFRWPVLVVSIGSAAARACLQASNSQNSKVPRVRMACWRPNTESQVHRFTISNVLLHLGVDIFYFDVDTFFFRNPLPHILAQASASRLEALFASHADGDCINIGLFYLHATDQCSAWFSSFLQWYHDHQYEIDQRGLDHFLGSPRRQSFSDMGISYPPPQLPSIRSGALEDNNTVVIGFIGWAGHISRMLVFHWCNLPLEKKWRELVSVYDAVEAIDGMLPFDVAISAASHNDFDIQDNHPWNLVQRARSLFEAYKPTVPPQRLESTRCW